MCKGQSGCEHSDKAWGERALVNLVHGGFPLPVALGSFEFPG